MDPVQKIWLYEQWLGDHRDDAELAKNHAYLIGSFWNAEAVQQMMNDNVHESSDEDMEESMKMVKASNIKLADAIKDPNASNAPKRRRRKATLVSQDKRG
jgi:hypothetical protein